MFVRAAIDRQRGPTHHRRLFQTDFSLFLSLSPSLSFPFILDQAALEDRSNSMAGATRQFLRLKLWLENFRLGDSRGFA